ncbi:MAG: energy transducer TonB [Alphaproteobacteria bacterium]|jgi:protein TonB|nr:energy transducer TonB [Alphaproteobacteria bacterium]
MKESLRWGGSFVFVLALHAGAVGIALGWTHSEAPYAPPPAAVMIEMAPVPAAPEATPNEAPPGPELSEVIPEPEPPPPVEMPPPVMAEVTLPDPEPPPPLDLKPPPPPPKPPEKKVEKKPPQPKVSAPQAAPQQAAVAAAPLAGATPEPPSAALPTWKGLLLRHLERHKRYPSEAQRARHEGVTYVRFTMSRDGRVLAARIERASGISSLDQEGLELLQRAQPLPPLPSDQPGESLEIVVPIQFFLRR